MERQLFNKKRYDLMFITDATGSMGNFISDLQTALPQIFDLVQLTSFFDRVSVLGYRDYCDMKLIEWSGWKEVDEADELTTFVRKLRADGGGDAPEAAKTGLWEASKKVEKPTICIYYLDAPPHHVYGNETPGDNYKKELKALGSQKFNWIYLCNELQKLNMKFFPITSQLRADDFLFFVSLADITGGRCFALNRTTSIVQATIGILLSLGDVEFEFEESLKLVKAQENFSIKEHFLKNGTQRVTEANFEHVAPAVEVIEDIKERIGKPVQRFRYSEEYQNLVFTVFKRLLTPERVMAFTYNQIFGKLWREICAHKKDARRDQLVVQFSTTVNKMADEDKEKLQGFIDETYNQSAEIEEILSKRSKDGPFFVIDHLEPLPRKTIYEIGLSCAPYSIKAVSQLLTGLRVADKLPSEESRINYIPVDLESELKFKLLPNLMCPGTMFTTRMSLIMAAIAKTSGSILREEATEILVANKGKWIDLIQPENNSMDFARLLLKIPEALTEDETKHLRALVQVGYLKNSKDREIKVEISYSSHKTKRRDFKDRCKKCKQWRSMSLLLDDTCALCVEGIGKTSPGSQDDELSWMCECISCLVHYAVYAVDALKCRPKCHFCRIYKKAPYVECQKCFNKFLYQQSKIPKNFTCAVCTDAGDKLTEKQTVKIIDYITQNTARFIGMEIVNVEKFFDPGNKIFKMTPEERLAAVRNFKKINKKYLVNHKIKAHQSQKQVWNVLELQKEILEIFTKPHMGQCMICFETFDMKKLMNICGRVKKGCSAMACTECLNTWYNQMSPGEVCQPAQLVCPYCKQAPLVKIVRRYNRQLCALMNVTDISSFDPSYIYAWCRLCFEIKQAIPRECGADQEIKNFTCAPCVERTTRTPFTPKTVIAKECPKCKVMTEKIDGCNHITCTATLPDGKLCDAHWCWECRALSSVEEIYDHMSREHGGCFYVGDEDE